MLVITLAPWTWKTISPGWPARAGSTPAGLSARTPAIRWALRASPFAVNGGFQVRTPFARMW